MVKIDRSFPAPESLAEELKKGCFLVMKVLNKYGE